MKSNLYQLIVMSFCFKQSLTLALTHKYLFISLKENKSSWVEVATNQTSLTRSF